MSHPNDDSQEMMQRRELLRRAAWLLGGAISAPAALAILQGCSAKESAGERRRCGAEVPHVPRRWPSSRRSPRSSFPKTDTSGAKDAGVPAFIDATLAAVYPQKDQERFKAGLGEFEAMARGAGKPFLEREPAERADFVKQWLVAALARSTATTSRSSSWHASSRCSGYFTSQVGITENMEYVPVPTAFHGCVPLSQMKKHVYWE